MRIKGIHLAGVALAFVSGAKNASAADAPPITNSTSTPVSTSTANGGSAGNVTIASGGSVNVTAGQTAVTIDSNNTVTNGGLLSSTDANDTTGVAILGGFTG